MLWVVLVEVTVILVLVSSEREECKASVGGGACTCDSPYTLRCSGPGTILPLLSESLRNLRSNSISLLDLSLQNLEVINGPILQNVSLHGLVISSGALKWISPNAFRDLHEPFEALGLPNNLLESVPSHALEPLKSLTRLDVSNNSIVSLDDNSLKGLSRLQVLDLQGNKLKAISPLTFLPVPILKVLHLQMNYLSASVVSSLHGLMNLEEFDLSRNYITGPLNVSTLPRLPKLQTLNLGNNQISSVTKGALPGLDSLKHLSLGNNMIDVVEDHAFLHLSNLVSLDLSRNRVVAVSEASLAHLNDLQILDFSHNFLRAVTQDLVSPLKSLQVLKLDDNDISMVAKNTLDPAKKLKALTLSENPLNCDCNMAYFAEWLKSSSIDTKQKNSAVCATPPSLENGLVNDLTNEQLACRSDDDLSRNSGESPMPLSGSRVSLNGFGYAEDTAYLLWKIETTANYSCDSLFIYEELGSHEILLEHNHLHCNSTDLLDPHVLPVSIQVQNLQKGRKYRFCLVMVERAVAYPSLILGCSEVLSLADKISPQILSLTANMTSSRILTVKAQVWPQNSPCFITFHVSGKYKSFTPKRVNCSSPTVYITGLLNDGPYKICAVIPNVPPNCIYTDHIESNSLDKPPSLIMFFIFFLILLIVVFILYRWLKNVFSRPQSQEQCFLATPQNDQQHTRYVKLQATTKV